MNKRETISLINSTYRKLYHALDPYGTGGNYAEQIYTLERKAEIEHRRFAPRDYRHKITLAVAARLFVCRHLLTYYVEPTDTIKAADILDTREAVLLACAVAARYRESIAQAVTEEEARAFLDSVDYVALVR